MTARPEVARAPNQARTGKRILRHGYLLSNVLRNAERISTTVIVLVPSRKCLSAALSIERCSTESASAIEHPKSSDTRYSVVWRDTPNAQPASNQSFVRTYVASASSLGTSKRIFCSNLPPRIAALSSESG